ncbi:uncharacterized protein [Palaemon carinicauda]|uniref:uncharacterized protein n=1 Tax=Palaemon carinicauda TaxID=392227 RepID=UPI0035B5AD68
MCSQLLVYTRCIWKESLEEDMFCCSLETSATADGVFKAVSDFFQDHDISWEKLIGVCTDGAPTMLGTRSGFVTKVKEKAPSLQGKNTTVIAHSDAIRAFIGKLQVWKRRIQKMNTSSFPNLNDILNEESFSDSLKTEIEDHLKRLENEFQRYNPRIGEMSYVFSLARNPFSLEVDDVPEDLQEQFRELKFNSVAKDDFTSLKLYKEKRAKCIPHIKILPNGTPQPKRFSREMATAITCRDSKHKSFGPQPSIYEISKHKKLNRKVTKLVRKPKINGVKRGVSL